MESESYLGVSVASKGILHYFKNALAKKQMTLHNLIYYLFKFDKVIFSRSEFLQLIVHCDPHRKYDSIDLLFEELDENKNNRVEVEKLKAILNLISEEDNPRLRSQLMKSRIFSIED